jgi:hypothetical protein
LDLHNPNILGDLVHHSPQGDKNDRQENPPLPLTHIRYPEMRVKNIILSKWCKGMGTKIATKSAKLYKLMIKNNVLGAVARYSEL